jgi:putative transport protein
MHLLLWLSRQPFILLFLVVAAGIALGRVKIKGVGLGATASSLLIALAVSVLAAGRGAKITVPELTGTIFFNVFMFSVGMKVGPQFLAGLKRDAGKFFFFGLFMPLAATGLMLALRALMPLAPGLLPGILAGSNTATPGLGAAQAAYATTHATNHPETLANLSTSFAFTYCLSTVLFVLFAKLPDLFGRNTARAAREFEERLRESSSSAPLPGTADEFMGGPLPVARRSYQLEKPQAVGHRLGELRRTYPLVAIERVLRAGQLLEPADDVVLQPHDTLALYGRVPRLLNAASVIGPEVDVPELGDIGSETVDVVAHRGDAIDKTILALASDVGHGLFLNAMFRGGVQIPWGPDTVVRRGDVLRVTGSRWRIKTLEAHLGRVVRASVSTDIVTLALGVSAGSLLGAVTIPLGGLKLAVGSAVGLLLVGIVLSILRTRQPGLGGPFPEPARQLLEDLGLNIFVVVMGLNAGSGVIKALSAGAVGPILIGTLVVGFVPAIIAWVVGAFAFKMNGALLLGALAGGRCNSAGMRAAQEASRSNVPALSYPVTFALSNVVLTVMTYVFAIID